MVARRLEEVRERIAAAAARAGRAVDEITLVAIGKSHPAEMILEAYEVGQRDFGENRAAEMLEKAASLPTGIRWHFVGSLQSRKAESIRPVTHLLHSMDRTSLARRWTAGVGDSPPVLLQVNIGEEPQKHGVLPAEVEARLDEISHIGIRPVGLMAIPPVPESPEAARPHFRSLAALFERVRSTRPEMTMLSMGMTDDFEVAVEEGATLVRVGRAIFGSRTG